MFLIIVAIAVVVGIGFVVGFVYLLRTDPVLRSAMGSGKATAPAPAPAAALSPQKKRGLNVSSAAVGAVDGKNLDEIMAKMNTIKPAGGATNAQGGGAATQDQILAAGSVVSAGPGEFEQKCSRLEDMVQEKNKELESLRLELNSELGHRGEFESLQKILQQQIEDLKGQNRKLKEELELIISKTVAQTFAEPVSANPASPLTPEVSDSPLLSIGSDLAGLADGKGEASTVEPLTFSTLKEFSVTESLPSERPFKPVIESQAPVVPVEPAASEPIRQPDFIRLDIVSGFPSTPAAPAAPATPAISIVPSYVEDEIIPKTIRKQEDTITEPEAPEPLPPPNASTSDESDGSVLRIRDIFRKDEGA